MFLWLTPVDTPVDGPTTESQKTQTREKIVKNGPSPAAGEESKMSDSTVTKVTPSDRGLVQEAFANTTGIVLIRIGLAALAAFLAAAFVQRLIMARFVLKVGPGGVELEPTELEEANKNLENRLTQLEEHAKKADTAFRELVHELRKSP